jgi:hypothetical protein
LSSDQSSLRLFCSGVPLRIKRFAELNFFNSLMRLGVV